MKVFIQYQDRFGHWKPYQTTYNERDAFKTAQYRAKSTGNRYRLLDENHRLLDIIDS